MKHRHHSSRWILLLAATTSLGVSGLARAQVPFMDENLDVALLMEGFAINPENLDSLVLAELGYLGYVREVQVAALIEEAAAQVEAQAAEALENQELFGTDLVTADYGHCDTYGAWVGEYARLVATVPEDTSDATNDNTQSVDVQGFSEVLVGPCDCWTTEEFDIEGARLGLEATALILTGGETGDGSEDVSVGLAFEINATEIINPSETGVEVDLGFDFGFALDLDVDIQTSDAQGQVEVDVPLDISVNLGESIAHNEDGSIDHSLTGQIDLDLGVVVDVDIEDPTTSTVLADVDVDIALMADVGVLQAVHVGDEGAQGQTVLDAAFELDALMDSYTKVDEWESVRQYADAELGGEFEGTALFDCDAEGCDLTAGVDVIVAGSAKLQVGNGVPGATDLPDPLNWGSLPTLDGDFELWANLLFQGSEGPDGNSGYGQTGTNGTFTGYLDIPADAGLPVPGGAGGLVTGRIFSTASGGATTSSYDDRDSIDFAMDGMELEGVIGGFGFDVNIEAAMSDTTFGVSNDTSDSFVHMNKAVVRTFGVTEDGLLRNTFDVVERYYTYESFCSGDTNCTFASDSELYGSYTETTTRKITEKRILGSNTYKLMEDTTATEAQGDYWVKLMVEVDDDEVAAACEVLEGDLAATDPIYVATTLGAAAACDFAAHTPPTFAYDLSDFNPPVIHSDCADDVGAPEDEPGDSDDDGDDDDGHGHGNGHGNGHDHGNGNGHDSDDDDRRALDGGSKGGRRSDGDALNHAGALDGALSRNR